MQVRCLVNYWRLKLFNSTAEHATALFCVLCIWFPPPSKRRLGHRLRARRGVIPSGPRVDVHRFTGLSCLSGPPRSSPQVEASFIQTFNNNVFFLHYIFDTSIFLLLIFIYRTKSTVVFRGLNVGPFYIIKRNLLQLLFPKLEYWTVTVLRINLSVFSFFVFQSTSGSLGLLELNKVFTPKMCKLLILGGLGSLTTRLHS